MNKTVMRYLVLNLALFFILLLIILSITGAFLGTRKASLFFNSPPLAIFWIVLTLLFVAGFVFWKSLRRRPYLLLCHTGCLAVLVGGIWGSRTAHRVREAVGMEPKMIKGMMVLRQGQIDRQVFAENKKDVFELPFSVYLVETGVTHYDDPSIGIYNRDGRLIGRIGTEVGYVYQLDQTPSVEVHVTRRFENLRLEWEQEGVLGVEGPPGHSNPGYEIVFVLPDGSQSRQYVFERVEPHFMPHLPYQARYLSPMIPREYRSLLRIEKDGQIVKGKSIRVNDPLYYGGYHFYQSTFGQDEIGPYSGIMVVSDSGVWVVFLGYALLTAGLFGQYWIEPLRRSKRQEGRLCT